MFSYCPVVWGTVATVPDERHVSFPVSQPARIGGSELETPESGRLVRHDDLPFRLEILNVSEAEIESV